MWLKRCIETKEVVGWRVFVHGLPYRRTRCYGDVGPAPRCLGLGGVVSPCNLGKLWGVRNSTIFHMESVCRAHGKHAVRLGVGTDSAINKTEPRRVPVHRFSIYFLIPPSRTMKLGFVLRGTSEYRSMLMNLGSTVTLLLLQGYRGYHMLVLAELSE